MADETGISWCDATFNPWIGCAKVSPACARCYAETFAENRMGLRDEKAVWGADAHRRIVSEVTWRNPLRWARLAREGLLPNGKENQDGHRPRIFCASMADVFEERPDLEGPRGRLLALMAATPELDWLVLTKRPEFARDWLAAWADGMWGRAPFPEAALRGWLTTENRPRIMDWPLPNVWLGVSIENSRFTWRADVLREIPAAVRFISAEPLLGSLYDAGREEVVRSGPVGRRVDPRVPSSSRRAPLDLSRIDWVICGGESGGFAARPMHPDWARELRDDAFSRGIAFHFKQWGSWGPRRKMGVFPGDLFWTVEPRAAWTEKYVVGDDYVCAPNETEAEHLRYHGPSPKASGKLLDGVEHCDFPGVLV